MEKKELRKKIEELDVKRKVKEIRGDTPDYDTDNRYHYVSEEDILELLDKAREEGKIEVLTEIFQTCYQEDSKTLELVEEKLAKLKGNE